MAKIKPAERQMNLIIALVNSRNGLTRAEIQSRIDGYDPTANKAAFERMLERDKKDLRALGMPLETLGVDGPAEDIRYRMDMDNYAMAELSFNRGELTAIALAHNVIGDKELHAELGTAVQKLLPVTDDSLDITDGVELAAHVRPVGLAFVALAEAIQQRMTVRFTYRSARSATEEPRTIQPYRLRIDAGARYVHGLDCTLGEPRTFRLSRILGSVEFISEPDAYEIPDTISVEGASDTVPVILAIRPDVAHHIRRLGEPAGLDLVSAGVQLPVDADIVRIETDNVALLSEEIAACADDVLVISPDEVRKRVLERLRSAVQLGGTADDE